MRQGWDQRRSDKPCRRGRWVGWLGIGDPKNTEISIRGALEATRPPRPRKHCVSRKNVYYAGRESARSPGLRKAHRIHYSCNQDGQIANRITVRTRGRFACNALALLSLIFGRRAFSAAARQKSPLRPNEGNLSGRCCRVSSLCYDCYDDDETRWIWRRNR